MVAPSPKGSREPLSSRLPAGDAAAGRPRLMPRLDPKSSEKRGTEAYFSPVVQRPSSGARLPAESPLVPPSSRGQAQADGPQPGLGPGPGPGLGRPASQQPQPQLQPQQLQQLPPQQTLPSPSSSASLCLASAQSQALARTLPGTTAGAVTSNLPTREARSRAVAWRQESATRLHSARMSRSISANSLRTSGVSPSPHSARQSLSGPSRVQASPSFSSSWASSLSIGSNDPPVQWLDERRDSKSSTQPDERSEERQPQFRFHPPQQQQQQHQQQQHQQQHQQQQQQPRPRQVRRPSLDAPRGSPKGTHSSNNISNSHNNNSNNSHNNSSNNNNSHNNSTNNNNSSTGRSRPSMRLLPTSRGASPRAATTPPRSSTVTPICTPRALRGGGARFSNAASGKSAEPAPAKTIDDLDRWYAAPSSEDRFGMMGSHSVPPARLLRDTSVSSVGSAPGLFEEVSQLVSELEAARIQATEGGRRPPKAIEEAINALGPLLRLRDITGGVSCDLSGMPWLPQLLDVFRNVLHTAVEGTPKGKVVLPKCTNLIQQMHCADSGAGQPATACIANLLAAFEDTNELDFGQTLTQDSGDSGHHLYDVHGIPSVTCAELQSECEILQRRVREQDVQLSAAFQTEMELRRSSDSLRTERDELRQRVFELEALLARRDERSEMNPPMTSLGSMAATTTTSFNQVGSPTSSQGCDMTRRLTQLELENRAFHCETRDAEDRLAELLEFVEAAVQAG